MAKVLQAWWLGEEAADVARVAASAVVVYVVALWIVRTGKKRFLGRNTVFDVLLAFVLGSVLARAINGGAPLLSTVVAGFALVGMHWLFGTIALRSRRFGHVVKGGTDQLVANGKMDEPVMRRHHITEADLLEAARLRGVDRIEDLEAAYFERNGSVSVVPKSKVETITLDVEEGVQKVEVRIVR